MAIKSYKDLVVWQKAVALVKEIYRLSDLLPESEKYVLVPQLKRAVISIPSNITEGFGRQSVQEREHFTTISYGSSLELETQLTIIRELSLVKPEDYALADGLINEVSAMLNAMTVNLRKRRFNS